MSNELEKAKMSIETVATFFNKFGNDVHAQILLEVLMEGVMNEEAVFIFGEPEQERREIDHNSPRAEEREQQDSRCNSTEIAPDMGA